MAVVIEPESLCISPAIHLISVDLPEPEYPIIDTIWFLPMFKVTSSSTFEPLYVFVRWLMLIIDEKFIIDYSSIINEILNDLKNNIEKSIIAMKFHNSVVEFSYEVCKKLREIYNINQVALSGGVFQNNILFIKLHNKLQNDKFEILTHKLIPCNDSGISIGQLIIAQSIIANSK